MTDSLNDTEKSTPYYYAPETFHKGLNQTYELAFSKQKILLLNGYGETKTKKI